MFVVIYQNKDICYNDQGESIFSYEDALTFQEWLVVEGFDCQDYKIAKLSFLD